MIVMATPAIVTGRRYATQHKGGGRSTSSLFDGKTLNGWIDVENNATNLSSGSILDPAAFAAKLAHGEDPMAVLLRGEFDSALKSGLSAYPTSSVNVAVLLSAMVKQINQILAGPAIFTAGRFREIALRPETEALLRQYPRGARLARLNKMLLEDSFPLDIVKTEVEGWIVKDGMMASTGAGRGIIYTAQDYFRYRLLYCVRHVSGHPDHQAGVLFFCQRPEPEEMPLDALGGIQFQLPMGSYWDYRPGNNNSGSQFFETVNKSQFDRHAWSQVELLVDAGKGTAQLAVAQPPGNKAVELARFSDPTAGKRGPIAWQMHNSGLFDEYKDISIELNPEEHVLLTTGQDQSRARS